MTYKLSIDPSLSCTGWSVLEIGTNDLVACGKIATKGNEEEDTRILKIVLELINIAVKYRVVEAGLESQYVARNKRTAMQLSRLRGGIMVGLRMNNVKIKYITPSEVKKAITGNGDATKEEVMQRLSLIYKNNKVFKDIGPFVDASRKDKTSDIYDSIAIGLSV